MRRAALLAGVLVFASLLPEAAARPPAAAQVASGRVVAAARGQVAWLDLAAARPTPLTTLVRPTYPADVAAVAGVPFAVASIVSPFAGSGGQGGDLVLVDLTSGATTPLLARQSEAESLDQPAVWPDGSAVLYQRSNLRAAVPIPGQAAPQYQSRIEQIKPDGSGQTVLLDDARYPSPAPDGSHLVFVRSSSQGSGLYTHALADGAEATVVGPGPFVALAYPRFSPDGQHLAFVAISTLSIPTPSAGQLPPALGAGGAWAHGFPREVWLVDADGSNLHAIPSVLDDDPSVAWSPDGTQLLVYGGWGGYLVEVASGEAVQLPNVSGYGLVAWLPG